MNRKRDLIFASVIVVMLSACGTSRPIRYYTIQPPTAPAVLPAGQAVSLLIAPINSPEILRQSPIAYRVGANEIGTYQYSRWEEPPVEMLQSSLIRILKASGNYRSVASLGGASDGQFLVRGRLFDFEEVDAPTITAFVSMEFELLDRKSGHVVWAHSYSQAEPVHGKEMSAVVTALDTNLHRGLQETVASLDQYFSANPIT